MTVGTDYALSILSESRPRTLPLCIVLEGAPQFFLNNPIALQRKYIKLMGDPNMRKVRAEFRKGVKAGEQEALEMLVDLFD